MIQHIARREQASIHHAAGAGAVVVALVGWLACAGTAAAESASDRVADSAWQARAIAHAQAMREFRDRDKGAQPTPRVIPQFGADFDPTGLVATDQPGGQTVTSTNPFFQDLGTNQRTCFTCHQPQNGWSISAQAVQARFNSSVGTDPIFRLVDGATCPSDDVSSVKAKLQSYSLLLSRGLIRIGLAIPANAQFEVAAVDDPYHCNTNPATGLTSPTSGIVSVYRRPLPSTNLDFASAVMWDGREPDLFSQAVDATLGHAQGNAPPTVAQQQQIVDFETGIFTAQLFDRNAQNLTANGANGGPVALSQQLAQFFIGVNDPFGLNPTNAAFSPIVFDLYDDWAGLRRTSLRNAKRAQIARGQAVFNDTVITISGVAGINDVLKQANFTGACATCHDTPNVGDHSVKAPLDIGIADAGAGAPPVLDISHLPVFTLDCVAGPLKGQVFTVTDPGRALISGNCADIGKLKGPILRGLAARAPYFHNGSAGTLSDAVDFYDQRFAIGFTTQQKLDLVAFLNTL